VATTGKNAQHGPPRVDSLDGPTADSGGSGGSGAAFSYVMAPSLQVIWGPAPNITGDVGAVPPPSSDGPTPNSHRALTVDLGSIRDAENGMLDQSKQATADYMSLRATVKAAIDGHAVFGQQATMTVAHPSSGVWYGVSNGPGPQTPDSIEPDQAIVDAANQYAQVMEPWMLNVLVEAGNALESVGQFIALLDKAGQHYAYADKNSFFPDPPPPMTTA
jgi:hypothetical protein